MFFVHFQILLSLNLSAFLLAEHALVQCFTTFFCPLNSLGLKYYCRNCKQKVKTADIKWAGWVLWYVNNDRNSKVDFFCYAPGIIERNVLAVRISSSPKIRVSCRPGFAWNAQHSIFQSFVCGSVS
jgi:hypothetical protein